MTTILLTAGKAERLGDLAPGGCKALVDVGGRTMLDWWRDFAPELIVVCRSEHEEHLPDDVRRVVTDMGGGPAVALAAALPACNDQDPVTVAFADTWVPELPAGRDWCGVAAARGGRSWYVVEDGFLHWRDTDLRETLLVSIGLFRFGFPRHLESAISDVLADNVAEDGVDEIGLDLVVNAYGGLHYLPIFGWQDVGDVAALSSWRPL